MRVQAYLLLLIITVSCTNRSDEINFKKGMATEESNPNEAIGYYTKVFEQSSDKSLVVESAIKLFNIYYYSKKNYVKAYRYLNYIVPNTQKFKEAHEALKLKALVEFKHLSYYEKAIESYNKLLAYEGITAQEEREYRWNLVKSYVEINSREQALVELEELKKLYKDESDLDVKIFEASIFQGNGDTAKAIALYKMLETQAENPEQKKEILMNLALCYEQEKKYSEAMQALEKISKKDPILNSKKKQLQKMATIKKRQLRK